MAPRNGMVRSSHRNDVELTDWFTVCQFYRARRPRVTEPGVALF